MTITCTLDNFVPLVIPGLSSPSCSNSVSTSRRKDQSNSSGKSETSTDPTTKRRSKHACGKQMQTNPDTQASGSLGPAHKKNEMNKEDPTQSIPDWLQPFTYNPEDLETHVLAHSSERDISDSEKSCFKWRHIHGSTVFKLTSQKNEIARSLKGPKLRGFRAEDAMRDHSHEQESLAT